MARRSPAGRQKRRRKRSPYERAVVKYTVAAKSLIRLAKSARTAVSEWSRMADTAADETGRKAAAKMLAGSVARRNAARDLLRICCLDGEGHFGMVPGVWGADIAAGAEGMASLANRDAAMWSADGAPSSAAVAASRAVLAELSASNAWVDFAARVDAAERAAVGTALEARPVEERAAAAARLAERSVPTLPREGREGGGGAGPATGAMGSGMVRGRAAVAAGKRAAAEVRRFAAGSDERLAEMRRGAASMWEAASALWSKVHEKAAREGDPTVVRMATVWAKKTEENAARLRAV